LSRFTYNKEETSQATTPSADSEAPSEDNSQIVYLKRLLLTLKQKYENHLHSLAEQIQTEASKRADALAELQQVQLDYENFKQHHEEELSALKQQHSLLKELLKKAQELNPLNRMDANQIPEGQSGLFMNQQRMEQLERVLPYLRERTEEAHQETEQLREDLEAAEQKISHLQEELFSKQSSYEAQIQDLKQTLAFYATENPEEPSQIHHELKLIREKLLQGAQESKVIETRYMEILGEKNSLELHLQQLQQQLDSQSYTLASFNQQMQEMEMQKRMMEEALEEKSHLLNESLGEQEALKEAIGSLPEKYLLQEKYEQIKEDVLILSQQLEDALEGRINAEKEVSQFQILVNEQSIYLHDQESKISFFNENREGLELEIQEIRRHLEEHELSLKMAQQHLAKKVKEVNQLTEKVETQHLQLIESQQVMEVSQAQIAHLQASVDIYQKQEKRMQDQLHDALKTTENQVNKWEEKYFKMYDNWQQSQNEIRELKKFEEKHNQMQSLLSNLGTFMGSSNTGASLLQSFVENREKGPTPVFERPQGATSFDATER